MKMIKKVMLTAIAAQISLTSFAQGPNVNMDLTPLKTSLGKVVLDGVSIVCFLFFIIGLIGCAWNYNKDNQEAFKGFIAVVALTAIIGFGAYVAKQTFLG